MIPLVLIWQATLLIVGFVMTWIEMPVYKFGHGAARDVSSGPHNARARVVQCYCIKFKRTTLSARLFGPITLVKSGSSRFIYDLKLYRVSIRNPQASLRRGSAGLAQLSLVKEVNLPRYHTSHYHP